MLRAEAPQPSCCGKCCIEKLEILKLGFIEYAKSMLDQARQGETGLRVRGGNRHRDGRRAPAAYDAALADTLQICASIDACSQCRRCFASLHKVYTVSREIVLDKASKKEVTLDHAAAAQGFRVRRVVRVHDNDGDDDDDDDSEAGNQVAAKLSTTKGPTCSALQVWEQKWRQACACRRGWQHEHAHEIFLGVS